MNKKDLLFHLSQRFRELQRAKKDLAFKEAEWARDAIKACGNNRAFSQYARNDLGQTETQIRELIRKATAATVVPDAKTWNALGGEGQISAVRDLPRPVQVRILETSKVTKRAVPTLVKDWKSKHPEWKAPEAPAPVPRVNTHADARQLAEYICSAIPYARIPSTIRATIGRYVASFQARKAA